MDTMKHRRHYLKIVTGIWYICTDHIEVLELQLDISWSVAVLVVNED